MKLIYKIIFIGLIILGSNSFSSYAETVTDIVDQFKQATDLQRQEIISDFFGIPLSAEGTITNVEEYNLFDEKKDVVHAYYRITTDQQKTTKGNPYQIIFLTKEFGAVKDLQKGQCINRKGKIIRIIDQRLQISIWIYDGQLSPEDTELFKQVPNPPTD